MQYSSCHRTSTLDIFKRFCQNPEVSSGNHRFTFYTIRLWVTKKWKQKWFRAASLIMKGISYMLEHKPIIKFHNSLQTWLAFYLLKSSKSCTNLILINDIYEYCNNYTVPENENPVSPFPLLQEENQIFKQNLS